MRSSVCFSSLDVLAENPAPRRAAEGTGGQARSGPGSGTLQGDTAWGSPPQGRRSGQARAPPLRGPVSRQRGGLGRRPRGAAPAGRGRGRAPGSAGAASRLPWARGPGRAGPRCGGGKERGEPTPSRCRVFCTNVPSYLTSPGLTRAKYALGIHGFPRSGSAW